MFSQEDKKFTLSWFFKWFLNNQAVTVLMVSLLVFLNIFVLTKISFLFAPVLSFLAVIMLPVVISALLYYLLKPIVDLLEKAGASRITAITLVFIVLSGLLIWGVAVAVPSLVDQILTFADNLPSYLKEGEKQVNLLLKNNQFNAIRPQLENMVNNFSSKAADYAETFSKSAVNWVGNVASLVTRVAVAIMISPFILFYLLRDSGKFKERFIEFLPTKIRQPSLRVLSNINAQLSSYVQGQVTVAIVVAILFSIMFSIIQLRYATTLAIIAGILNMVPYLGSFLAMIPAFILAMVAGPIMVIKVAVVFIIEQTIEGRFVTPLVIGSKLNIHPITILFVLLTAGSMFGVWGVFLAIPIYASVKVILSEIFTWYKAVSGLYVEDIEEVGEGNDK
ncbi:AI-2E family transporter [Streptococcus sp. SGI.013]|uniref:AI-2E family transporter n=1 Tax=unclassified Streptococcus TaxID=2608887 RepID=UPI003CFC2708